jgi:hypothetical protein
MKRLCILPVLLLSSIFLWSCRGCRQEEGPASILDLAPPDAMVVAHVPDSGRLIQGLASFVARATRKAGTAAVGKIRESFKTQFGFDGFDPNAYAALGIAGKGGALLFNEGAVREPLFALAIAEPEVFELKLKEIIQKTDGANHFTEARVDGFRVVTAGRPFGDEMVPAFHWAWVGRYVVIARDAGRPGLDLALKRLAANRLKPAAETVRTDSLYLKLSRKVSDPILSVFVRGSVAQELGAEAGQSAVQGAITGVTVDEQGVSSDSFVELAVPGLDQALQAEPVLGLTDRVASDAAVLLVSRSAKRDGIVALRSHPALATWLTRLFKPLADATAIDPEGELLPLLSGPLTVSIHLGDLSQLPARLKTRRDVGAFLDFVDVAVTAEIGDPKAFIALLQRSKTKLGERHIAIRQRVTTVNGEPATLFEPDTKEPRLGWGVIGRTYVYGVGPGRAEATLKLVQAKRSDLAKSLDGSVGLELMGESGSTVLVVRLGAVAKAAASIPMASGKAQAMGAEMLIGAALDLLRTVGDVAAAVSAEPDGLRLKLRERLQ